MSLATRCSSCGTVFRVVQDQLKVSEGWVRCGRCNAVFNALEGLFDLGREPEAAAVPADVDAAHAHAAPAVDLDPVPEDPRGEPPPERHDESDDDDDDDGPLTAPLELGDPRIDPIDAHLFRKRGAEAERASSVQVDARDRHEFSDAPFRFRSVRRQPVGERRSDAAHAARRRPPPTCRWKAACSPNSSGAQSAARAGTAGRCGPRSRRSAASPPSPSGCRWRTISATRSQRDGRRRSRLSSPGAGWRPCSVDAPSSIDELSLEHTDLTRAVGVDAFILSVTLRSHSGVALKLPSIDLALTDGNGRLVARRALAPRDFGVSNLIQPGAEAALQLMVNAGNARVAGYTAEIFYP